MAEKRPPLPEDDDGRTIASMNVEGMPWYVERREQALEPGHTPMSRRETLLYIWAAVRGGLLMFLLFAAVFALVIFFIGHIWGA